MKYGKIIDRISALTQLSPAERRLTALLETDTRQIALLDQASIAEKAGVAPATVSRFARKLGFTHFSSFMKALRDEVAQGIAPMQEYLQRKNASKAGNTAEYLNAQLSRATENIRQTFNEIDPAQFEQAVEWLSDEKRKVWVTGRAASESLASYFFLRASICRDKVFQIIPNSSNLGQQMADIAKNDVLLCLSYTRVASSTLRTMELFREFGGSIILIADRKVSAAARLADLCFITQMRSGIGMFNSYAATTVILDALYEAIALRRHASISARYARIEKIFDTFHTFEQ